MIADPKWGLTPTKFWGLKTEKSRSVPTDWSLYNDPVTDSYLLHAFVIENAYQAAASRGA